MTHRIPFVLAAVAMLAACGVESEEEAPLLDPGTEREQLIRLSVDLRGVHPSEAELRLYEGNPLIWERYVDEYIADPRFLDRMMEIFNEQYLVKNGMTYFDLDEAGLEGVDERVMADIIADEPLQLLRKVIAEDLPYSTMVTADYTMANPLLAQFWDIDYPAGATGWVDAQYNDARPHSGMLSMTTFWQKYPSMGGNANRHRANAVSKVFLCDDYLSRPIVLNRAAVDLLVQDPENAIATNQGCQSCHSTLDPLAANFFGFFTYEDDGGIETTEYKPELEEEWRAYSGKEPGYFGRPTSGIVEFGIELAADPRFSDCAVQTVFQGLTQRTVDEDDWTELSAHRLAFEADEMNIKTLVKSIVMSDEYLARSTTDPELAESLQGVRTASPAQIAGIVEDVTGYN